MKYLILFDGSSLSWRILETACRDAESILDDTKPPVEVLVLAFLDQIAGRTLANSILAAQNLLAKAVSRLECCGAFSKIEAEVIQSYQLELTSVVINRAKEWQADSIYMAVAATPPLPLPTTRFNWLGKLFGRPASPTEVVENWPEVAPLTSEQLRVNQLLSQTKCRVVLIDRAGMALRLHYVAPAMAKLKTPVVV
jgi:hypothetical protein